MGFPKRNLCKFGAIAGLLSVLRKTLESETLVLPNRKYGSRHLKKALPTKQFTILRNKIGVKDLLTAMNT
ncbi:Hypothetical protein PHPALM_1577 [Phytophthora palmivora]|uniref:Uncharacterized protein n=1 Tax=Phytophthora palmivora TaxID=4796 RepID=A0A2P4YS06_9STRA|nr:Hypothetical protein PHPALM_1577 [Phytophthora palmivora]